MKISRSLVIVGFFLALGSVATQPSVASAADSSGGNDIAVSTIQPANQVDKNQSYFDVLMSPGTEQDLEVVLFNNTDKEVTMLAEVNPATTNDNGVVDYDWNLESALSDAKQQNKESNQAKIDLKLIAYDPTLKFPLSTLATVNREIVIPAKSRVNVKVHVKMPKQEVIGLIAGGIRLTQKEDSQNASDSASGLELKNKFVYVIGIQLRQQADISSIEPNLKLDKKKITPSQIDFHNVLKVNLQNTTPIYIRNLTVSAKVYKRDSQQLLVEEKRENLKMAPNSNFNFGIDWQNQAFAAGNYQVKVTAETKEANQKWSWQESFTIATDKAEDLNSQALGLEDEAAMWSWWQFALIGLGSLAGIAALLYVISYYRVKRKKAQQRKQRKKAKVRKSTIQQKKRKSTK